MLKIVYLCPVHNRYDTRILDRTCGTLAEHWKTCLVTRHPTPETLFGVRVIPFPTYSNRLLRMTVGNLYLLRLALACKADVYVTVSPESLPLALFLKRFTKARVVHEVHEHFWGVLPARSYMPAWLGRMLAGVYRHLEAMVFPRLDGLIAATPGIYEEIHSYHPNTMTINNFPLIGDVPSPQPQEPPTLCYIGSLTRERGIDRLVEAMAEIDARLVLAGPFDPPELQAELQTLPGWQKVEYRGMVKREEALQIMQAARIGVIVFQPTPNNTRSYANKIFEYMAAGLPVLASDFPLWKTLVADNGCGVLVDPTSPQTIAAAANDLLQRPGEARQMGERGMEVSRAQYNWQKEAEKLVEFFRGLVQA